MLGNTTMDSKCKRKTEHRNGLLLFVCCELFQIQRLKYVHTYYPGYNYTYIGR